jgi:hypothetical protein
LVYASSPKVFVRSSYGGYFGISNFAVVLTCVSPLSVADPTKSGVAFAADLFAAPADHKLVFLPFAFAFWELDTSGNFPPVPRI